MRAKSAIAATVMAITLALTAAPPSQGQSPLDKLKKLLPKTTKKPPVPAVPGAPGAAAPGAAAAVQTLNAKVTEALMGPTVTGGLMSRTVMSDEGDHLAVVAAKGSRQVVLLDGVEGPAFDEIPLNFAWSASPTGRGSIIFSPTGGHSAYVARRGGDVIAVVDGKEAATLMTAATAPTAGYPRGWTFRFNQDGSHLAYGALGGPSTWVMVADGVKGSPYASIDFNQMFLEGKRLVYVAQTADQQWHAVVDGKPGPGYAQISALQVTPDGLHYAYRAQAGTKSLVVVDGVAQGQSYFGVFDLELAPDGRVAYGVVTKPGDAQGRGAEAALVVGGALQAGSCGTGPSATCVTHTNRLPGGITTPRRHVAWSPDRQGFAYVRSNAPGSGVTVTVNGKPMGPTYQVASELMWSPDGSRFAFLATSPSGFFQVVDGQEMEAANDVPEFQWSPDGKRYAFNGKKSLVVDGKDQPKPSVLREAFRWSPDSKHFAYASPGNGSNNGLVVDGEVKPFLLDLFQGTTQALPRIAFPPLSFSPDGAHLAHLGRTFDATGRATSQAGVVVDGARIQGPSESYMFPSWSPDSRHFATMVGNGRGLASMVDGKVGSFYETTLQNNAAACRFVNGRTLRFYGIKDGQIYRVTLDLE